MSKTNKNKAKTGKIFKTFKIFSFSEIKINSLNFFFAKLFNFLKSLYSAHYINSNECIPSNQKQRMEDWESLVKLKGTI